MLICGPGQSVPSVIGVLRSATCSHHARLASSPAMARLFAPDYTVQVFDLYAAWLSEPLHRAGGLC